MCILGILIVYLNNNLLILTGNGTGPGSNRGYCETMGNGPAVTPTGNGPTGNGEVDYPGQQAGAGQRPLSPQHILPHPQQAGQNNAGAPLRNNGYFPSNRASFPSPGTPSNNGSENFHPFHTDKLPNHLAEANTFPSIQQVSSFNFDFIKT